MEEQELDQIEEQSEDQVEDRSKREFVSKLVTAAGAMAVAGLVSPASGASTDLKLQIVTHKTDKVRNGFRMVFTGQPIGSAMQAAGVCPAGIDLRNARLTIEFTV